MYHIPRPRAHNQRTASAQSVNKPTGKIAASDIPRRKAVSHLTEEKASSSPLPTHKFLTSDMTMKRPMETAPREERDQKEEMNQLWSGWARVLSSRLNDRDPAEVDVRCSPERLRKHQRQPTSGDESARVGASAARSVRFAETADVRMVPSAKEMAAEEKSATWYTVQEQQANRLECGEVIQAMRQGLPIDEFRTTARGLERHRSDEHQSARRRRKVEVVRAVLAEQATQRRLGLDYPQSLRVASLKTSCLSRDIALTAAAWDQAAVGWNEARETLCTRHGCWCGAARYPRKPEHFTFERSEPFRFEPPHQVVRDSSVELCWRARAMTA